MIREEERTARKAHRCDGCRARIARGDRYRFLVASPNHGDLGNPHWWTLRDCADCAERRGKPLSSRRAS
jgi:hypothetical protein